MGIHKHHYHIDRAVARCRYLKFARFMTLSSAAIGLFITIVLGSFISPNKAAAAAYTWDGGGADNNWSTCANWSSDTCPTSTDTVTFNSTSTKNATIDASFNGTLAGMTITTGYSGTITVSRSLTVNGNYSQSTGTVDFGSQTFDLNGGLTLSGGTYTASSGSTTVSGALSVSGSPTFNHNSGTFTFDGTGSSSLSCNSISFNLVTFAHTANTKTVNSNCSLPLGANPSVPNNGAVVVAGTLSGSGTLSAAATSTSAGLTMNSTGVLSGFTGLATGSYTQSGGTQNFGSYTTFDIYSGFTLSSSASFTAPSATLRVGGAFTINSGTTYTHNSGTLQFARTSSPAFGVNSGTIACNNTTFNSVVFNLSLGTRTVNSDCNLPLGADPTMFSAATGAVITLNGTVTGTGTLTHGGWTLPNGISSLSGFTGINTSNGTLTLSGGSSNLSSYTTFDVAGFVLSSGATVTMPSTAFIGSSFTLSSGSTFNHNNGVINFDGSGGTLSCNNNSFGTTNFTHTSSTKVISADCTVYLSGTNPTFGSGTAGLSLAGTIVATGTLTVPGNTTLNSTYNLSGVTGLIVGGTFDVGASTTADLSNYTVLTVGSTFTNAGTAVLSLPNAGATFSGSAFMGGTINAGTGTINVALTLNPSGTLNATSATINLTGSGSVNCSGTTNLNVVNITNTSGTRTVNSPCSLPLGNNPTVGGGGAVVLAGTFTGSGKLSTNASTLTLNSGSVLSGFSGLETNAALSISSTLNAGSYNPFIVNGSLTLNSTGNLTAPSGVLSVGSTLTLDSSSTFNANGGTVDLIGGSAGLTCNSKTFNLVTFNNSGTKTVGSTCTLPLGANPTIAAGVTLNGTLSGSGTLHASAGTLTLNSGSTLSGFSGLTPSSFAVSGLAFDASSYSTLSTANNFSLSSAATFTAPSAMSVAGDITVSSDSTFNANNGTVTLNGSDQDINGELTFNNLNKTVSSAATLTFESASTQIVNGSLTLKGASGQLLSLVSSSPGVQWEINPTATRDLQYVSMQDGHNINATSVEVYDSVNVGNNTGWTFLTTPTPTPDPEDSDDSSSGSSTNSSSSSSSSSGSGSILIADATENETETITSENQTTTDDKNPNNTSKPSTQTTKKDEKKKSNVLFWFIIPGIGLPLLLVFLFVKRRSNGNENNLAAPATLTQPTIAPTPTVAQQATYQAPAQSMYQNNDVFWR